MRGTSVATGTDDHRTGTCFEAGSHVVVRGQVAGSGTHESKFAVLARSAIPVKTDFGTGIVDTRIGGIFAGTVMHHPCAIGHEVGIVVAVARLVVVADANNGRLVGSLHVAVSLRNDQAIAPERLVTDIRGTDTDHELRIPVATVHLANDCLVHTTRERMVVQGSRCLTRAPGSGLEQGAGVADVLEFHRVAADIATIHPEGAECLALRDGTIKLHEVVTVGTGNIHHIEIQGLESITFGRSARIDTTIFLPGLRVDDDTVALRDIDIPETVRDKAGIGNANRIAAIATEDAGTAIGGQAHAGGRILDDLTFGQRSIRCRFFNREEVGVCAGDRFAVCSEGERAHRMHPVVSRKGGRTDRCVDVAAGHHGIGTDCKGTIATNRSRIVAHGDAIQATEGNGAFTEGIGFVSETHAVPGVPVVFKTALRVGMVPQQDTRGGHFERFVDIPEPALATADMVLPVARHAGNGNLVVTAREQVGLVLGKTLGGKVGIVKRGTQVERNRGTVRHQFGGRRFPDQAQPVIGTVPVLVGRYQVENLGMGDDGLRDQLAVTLPLGVALCNDAVEFRRIGCKRVVPVGPVGPALVEIVQTEDIRPVQRKFDTETLDGIAIGRSGCNA